MEMNEEEGTPSEVELTFPDHVTASLLTLSISSQISQPFIFSRNHPQ
jgi:hypothetical protein